MYRRPGKFLLYVVLLQILSTGMLLAQVTMQSSTQPTSSEKAQSTSLSLVGTVGQSTPLGAASSGQFVLNTGFLNYLEKTLGDITAPATPSGLTVTPTVWTSVNDFNVSWANPEAEPFIGAAWYKIGLRPETDTDGKQIPGNIQEIGNLTVSSAGIHTIYIWLEDSLGNKRSASAAQGQLQYDNIPPEIQHTPVISQAANQAVTIAASGTDTHSQLQSLMLYYRKTGDISRIDSTDLMGGTGLIPGATHGDRGSEYVIYASDNAGNTSRSPVTGYYSVQAEYTSGITQPVALHTGNTVNDYRIVSLPLQPDNNTPSAVFDDDFGTYDAEKWKLFDVNNGALRDYNTIRSLPIVQPGKAFLLIMNLPDKKITSGKGKSASATTSSQVSLGTGWSLIGNPFNFDIPRDSLRVNGAIPQLWELTSEGWRSDPPHLKAWQGLAVYVPSPGMLHIGVGDGAGFTKSVADQFSGEDWGMQIAARGESGMDLDNFIGVYSNEIETERRVWHEAPQLENAISLSINTEKMTLAKPIAGPETRLASLIQQKEPDGNYWDFELRGGNAGEKIMLSFERFGNLPSSFSVFLIDKQMNMAHNLEFLDWKFETRIRNGNTGKFRVVVGNSDYVRGNSDGVAVVPLAYELKQNFPNPFNPKTSIVFTIPVNELVRLEVFDILGKKVSTLVNDRMMDAGYYQIDWDGHNMAGVPVASGIYIYRLRAGEFINMKKAILAR